MRKTWLVIFSVIWVSIACCLAGCGLMQTQDDGTFVVDVEKVEQLDAAATTAEAAGQIAILSSMWLPVLGPIGGLLVGAAGAWRNMKPKVEQAQSEAEIATAAGEATSSAIDAFKEKYPDDWAKLEAFFMKYHGQSAENFYRGLRGLPQKI
jgi:hypothetical protein